MRHLIINFTPFFKGDETLLLIAVAACLLGYGEVGLWLQSKAKQEGSGVFMEENPYRWWIKVHHDY
jgi:hydroxymethylpyrimidine/phosphomethylpyrimidine kinase / thiaminase